LLYTLSSDDKNRYVGTHRELDTAANPPQQQQQSTVQNEEGS